MIPHPTGQRNDRQADNAVGPNPNRGDLPWLFPQKTAIHRQHLAAGYLQNRRTIRREDFLDKPDTSSPHGHTVTGPEKPKDLGDHGQGSHPAGMLLESASVAVQVHTVPQSQP
jgi:hypothetical protein